MNQDFSTSIAVVCPSNWPVADDEAHCTVIYLGDTGDATFTKDDLLEVLEMVDWPLLAVRTGGIEMFGPDKNIPVVRLSSQSLSTLQGRYESLLNARGIKSASKFTDYKPHITVAKNIPDIIPKFVMLDTPVVWWGTDR